MSTSFSAFMAAISLRIWRNIFLLLAKQSCNYHRLKVDQGVGTRVREELNTRERLAARSGGINLG